MSFQTDAFQQDAFASPTFSLNAVIAAEQSATFGLDAELTYGGFIALDAVIAAVVGEGFVHHGTPGHQIAAPGNLAPGAFGDTPIDTPFSLDAVLLKTWDASFGLDGQLGAGLTTVTDTFGLDATVIIGAGMHSRSLNHFAEQSDVWITAVGVPGYADGTTLDVVLADLFGRASNLTPAFGLDAVIVPDYSWDETVSTFGLDARIAIGGSFGLDSVLKTVLSNTFGLSAYLQTTAVQGNGNMAMDATIKRTYTFSRSFSAVIVA